jgi:hypothetical protein
VAELEDDEIWDWLERGPAAPPAVDPYDEDAPIVRRRTGIRVVAAVLVVALIGLLVLQPSGIIFGGSGSSRDEADDDLSSTGPMLEAGPVGARLTDADWALQVGSAVQLGVGAPRCGGAVTEIAGRRYVTSARHCLEDLLGDDVLSPEPGLAQEVTGRLSGTLRVFHPDTGRVIASLDRIAVGTGDQDLLVATTRDETAAFREKPARPVDGTPLVGDEVATYASSGDSDFVPGRLRGVYLGQRTIGTGGGHPITVDLIGYRQASSQRQLGPGHSGHSATGAGGTGFGPLVTSIDRDLEQGARLRDLAAISRTTGIDLVGEGIVSVDEALHVDPARYEGFDAVLRA